MLKFVNNITIKMGRNILIFLLWKWKSKKQGKNKKTIEKNTGLGKKNERIVKKFSTRHNVRFV